MSVFLQTLSHNPVGFTVGKIFVVTPESVFTVSKIMINSTSNLAESVHQLPVAGSLRVSLFIDLGYQSELRKGWRGSL